MTKERVPDAATERRLEELRAEAQRIGRVSSPGIRPAGAPFPVASQSTGYYGLPLLKEPVWTWEVPAYFFVGGAAGAIAALGAVGMMTGAPDALVRDARWFAFAGANVSMALLITDLGRPGRFLSMLRVFKPQSPMSAGAWIVAAFGALSGASLAGDILTRRGWPVRTVASGIAIFAGIAGLGMATYTGVLIGATSIPVWSEHVQVLPAHFAASGLASGVALLELRGHRVAALNAIGLGAAAFETFTGVALEANTSVASEPLRHGKTGSMTRLGNVLSGPVPLVLRTFGIRSARARRLAAVSALAGSLITRFAWLAAGKVSARDPRPSLG